jgi:hypothetical protein
MTRTQIIAQINAQIALLQRAREILAGAPVDAKKASRGKAKKRVSPGKKKLIVAAPVESGSQVEKTVASPSPKAEEEPQVHRVPPKRRVERRASQRNGSAEKVAPAALSGLVPFGPVAVSANEARKVQERNVPPPPAIIEPEIRSNLSSERSLGSLVQAFERRAGLSGTGTP